MLGTNNSPTGASDDHIEGFSVPQWVVDIYAPAPFQCLECTQGMALTLESLRAFKLGKPR